MLFGVSMLMLLENSRINSILKSANKFVIVQSVSQGGLGFLESLVSVSVVEDLSPNLRDLALLSLRKSGLNGLLGSIGQMLEDVTSEVQVKNVRSDNSSVGSRSGGDLSRNLLLGVGLIVQVLNVIEILDAFVSEVLVVD